MFREFRLRCKAKSFPHDVEYLIGHDPVFIDAAMIATLPNLYPIFESRKLSKGNIPDLHSSSFKLPDILPIFTMHTLAKYPEDIVSLSNQDPIKVRTILAFLHSFSHFERIFHQLHIPLPPSVSSACSIDQEVRKDFNNGLRPSLSDLGEYIDLMLVASADVLEVLSQLWMRFVSQLSSCTVGITMNVGNLQFSHDWEKAMLVDECRIAIEKKTVPKVQLPMSMGWLMYWMSPSAVLLDGENNIAMNYSAKVKLYETIHHELKVFSKYRDSVNTIYQDGNHT